MSSQSSRTQVVPQVGMGVTMVLGSDRYPFVVTAVAERGNSITVRAIEAEDTGSVPWVDHAVVESPEKASLREGARPVVVTLRKDGAWRGRSTGVGFVIGEAVLYRNHAD